jgi:hypothetical protein
LLYLSLAVFILHWGLGGRSLAAMCFAIALDKSVQRNTKSYTELIVVDHVVSHEQGLKTFYSQVSIVVKNCSL